MGIESRVPFPVNRVIGAAAHAGESIMHHMGNPHAVQNAREAEARIAALKKEEPVFIEPVPTASQETWLHVYR